MHLTPNTIQKKKKGKKGRMSAKCLPRKSAKELCKTPYYSKNYRNMPKSLY